MDFIKEQTACFSGYRPHKFDFTLSGDVYDRFATQILQEITNAIEDGYKNFLVGGAPGFDIVAGEQVLFAKRFFNKRGVKLIAALPYFNFCYSKHFDEHWRDRFLCMLESCDGVINVNNKDTWSQGCYDVRNKFMVDNSSLLICYHTNKSGGTKDTIKYAIKNRLEIVNISDKMNS